MRYALLGTTWLDDKDILDMTGKYLGFNPAYACGEPADGFYRHMVRSYFYVDAKDRDTITEIPVALFSLPSASLNPLRSFSFRTQKQVFNISFTLNSEGVATKLKGKTEADNAIVKGYLSKFLPRLKFKPAMKDGVPVDVEMHFRIDLRTRYFPVYLSDAKVQKPLPVRPAEGNFSTDKTYSVLLDFYANGAVSNIQFLTMMNREESLSTLNAFRGWKIKGVQGGKAGGMRLKVEFGFAADSDEAVLIAEEFGRFTTAPRPVKMPAPYYPKELRRDGVEGTVLLMFVVDKNGKARMPKVIMSDAREFSEAAVYAVSQWEFEPATLNGSPVSARVRIPIPFRIQQR